MIYIRLHALLCSTEGALVFVFLTCVALTVASLMLSFVRPLGIFFLHTFLATCLAKNIDFVVEEVADIPLFVLLLQFVFTAGGARNRLASFARVCAIAELGLRLPLGAMWT